MSNLLNIKDQNGNWIPIPVITNGIQSITQNQDYTLTITLNDGTTYTTTSIKGEDGQDYILTENDKQEIAQDVAELVDIPVDDVQVNGVSVLNEGIANIPCCADNVLGVIKTQENGYYGIIVNSSGTLRLSIATLNQLKAGTGVYKPIASADGHTATFYGLAKASGDTTQSQSNNAVGTYTDEAKTAIKSMIGVEDPIVNDVQVNGASIVTDGVANIPIANASGTVSVGLVKPTSATGTAVASNGGLAIVQSNLSAIKTGANQYNPIVPQHQHESVFYGLAKIAGHDERESALDVGTYSDEAKSAIQDMLGVPSEDEVVTDVQIDSSSIVQNGVAEIPIAARDVVGLFKTKDASFYFNSQGYVSIERPSDNYIKWGEDKARVPWISQQHLVVFYGLAKAAGADEKNSTLPVGQYTESAQIAIKQMLGVKDDYDSLVVEVTGTDPVITGKASYRYNCGELYTLSITPPESGTMDIIFTSGATPTVLTLPNTVKMPTWWAGIDTNTTYEMCITDGVYCGVMSWAT